MRSVVLPAAVAVLSGCEYLFVFPVPPAPTLTSVEPVSGTSDGGTEVILRGTSLYPNAKAYFGDVEGSDVVVLDRQTVVVRTPPHPDGVVDVTVRNVDGREAVLAAGFTFLGNTSDDNISDDNTSTPGDKASLGTTCTTGATCESGKCADGVCCNEDCGGTCRACTLGATGTASGNCAMVLAGKDPDNECNATCNGSGVCGTTLQNPGDPCADDSECVGAHCVDGLCCAQPCDGLCVTCAEVNTGESNGTCAPITSGLDPNNECFNTCDGTGACVQNPQGGPCDTAADCSSGYCVEGVCCNDSCAQGNTSCLASSHWGSGGDGSCLQLPSSETLPSVSSVSTAYEISMQADGTTTAAYLYEGNAVYARGFTFHARWSTVQMSSAGVDAITPELGVAAGGGRSVVAWRYQGVRAVPYTGSSWSGVTEMGGASAVGPRVAADTAGNVVVVFSEPEGDANRTVKLRRRRAAEAWTDVPVGVGTAPAENPVLAALGASKFVLAWSEPRIDGNRTVWGIWNDANSTVSPSTPILIGVDASTPSVAANSDNRIMVGGFDTGSARVGVGDGDLNSAEMPWLPLAPTTWQLLPLGDEFLIAARTATPALEAVFSKIAGLAIADIATDGNWTAPTTLAADAIDDWDCTTDGVGQQALCAWIDGTNVVLRRYNATENWRAPHVITGSTQPSRVRARLDQTGRALILWQDFTGGKYSLKAMLLY